MMRDARWATGDVRHGWWFSTGIVALLALGGCHRGAAHADRSPTAAPAAHVKTVLVTEEKIPRFIFVTGSLAPAQQADVAAGIPGRVFSTFVERGMSVTKGAPLAALDRRSANAAAVETDAEARVAATQLRVADQDCKRAHELVAVGAVPRVELERAQGLCDAARDARAAAVARRERATVTLSDATVRAPFAGVVAERYVTAGEYVSASTRVATVMAIDSLRVELTLPESAVTQVQEGTPIEFSVSGDDGFPRHAVIRYVGPAVQRNARAQVVEAIVDNRAHLLRPGLFAVARLTVGATKLPAVPRSAVFATGGVERVMVVDRGVVTRRVVAIEDLSSPESVAVTTGLRAGERVISPYSDALLDGARVD